MIRQVLSMAAAVALPLVWFAVHFGGDGSPTATAVCAGLAIFGASFLLSWGSEAAQLDIPPALALIFVALVAVLPEYAVDVYFAWRAGHDPTYTAYATANMTGGNRLLLGVGWAMPVMAVWWRFGRRQVVLPREQAVEVRFLAAATLYSFVIPLKATLSLLDTAVLSLLFVGYLVTAARTHHVEPEIVGPAELLVGLRPWARRAATIGMFLFAGATILTAAEPFAESLIAIGRRAGIEEFLLVQWVAPLASESPEFIVALLFSLRGAAAAGIGTMISSKVNQWTLLIGALPVAFALAAGHVGAIPLDARQQEEIFLTSAQSLFGLVVIADSRFAVWEATLLFVLFLAQLFFTSATARLAYGGVYIGLAAGWLALNPGSRAGVLAMVRPRRG